MARPPTLLPRQPIKKKTPSQTATPSTPRKRSHADTLRSPPTDDSTNDSTSTITDGSVEQQVKTKFVDLTPLMDIPISVHIETRLDFGGTQSLENKLYTNTLSKARIPRDVVASCKEDCDVERIKHYSENISDHYPGFESHSWDLSSEYASRHWATAEIVPISKLTRNITRLRSEDCNKDELNDSALNDLAELLTTRILGAQKNTVKTRYLPAYFVEHPILCQLDYVPSNAPSSLEVKADIQFLRKFGFERCMHHCCGGVETDHILWCAIETKALKGSLQTAKRQTACWWRLWLGHTIDLVREAGLDPSAVFGEDSIKFPPLPTLFVQGDQWYFSISVYEDYQLVCLSSQDSFVILYIAF